MGLFNWAKTKTNNAKDVGKKVIGVKEIQASSGYIANMANVLLNPKNATKNAKKETFLQAKERLKVTDLEIITNYKNMVYGFYISLFFAVICFSGMIYNLFIQKSIFSALTTLAILGVCLANCFKFSFRAFQIKHQKLCAVNDWWNRAAEWFPKLPK
jgi:hypothetical protein